MKNFLFLLNTDFKKFLLAAIGCYALCGSRIHLLQNLENVLISTRFDV